MELASIVIVVVIVVLSSVWLLGGGGGKSGLPGPRGLPLLGYIPFMTNRPYETLTRLAQTYGPVYNLPLGSKNVLVLTGFRAIREAFSRDEFFGRAPDTPFELGRETLRLNAVLGTPFKEQRRFALHTFRDLGFGRTRLEEHLKEEIQDLLDRMSSLQRVRISDLLDASISNNIASLLFGRRLEAHDPRRLRLTRLLGDIGKYAGALSWQIFFPRVRAAMRGLGLGNAGRLAAAIERTKDFIRAEMKEHEATLDSNNVRDFLDAYLIEIQKRAHIPGTTFTREVLADVARAFFSAGSETVRITVDWMVLVCAERPEVQARMQGEIDEVLGGRFPGGQDRPRMPYTEAAICEMMRWKTIVPLNVMHHTLAPTELCGVRVPGGIDVLAVLWSVDHDPELWGPDAHLFRPERFLKDGKCVKPEHFIPFSTGKRQCPGKTFAEIELFLYIAALLQKFSFRLPPGTEHADLQETGIGVGMMPRRQELCIEAR